MPSITKQFFHSASLIGYIILSVTASVSALADNQKTMTCTSTTYEPYVYEENGKVVGIDADAVREIGQRLGIEITIALKPWARLERDMKLGTEECAFAYFRTSERLDYMHFTNVPLHITSYTLFVNQEDEIEFSSVADIAGWVVAVNQGFKTTPEFEMAVKEGHITEHLVREELNSFQMLNVKRVDAVLTNKVVGTYQATQLGYENITPLDQPLSSTAAYLTFAKKEALKPWVEKFDHMLFELLVDGTYQTMFEHYSPTQTAH